MVCRRLVEVPSQLPCPSRAKEGEKSEKHARQFKPQNAGEFHQWLPDRLSEAFAAANQSLTSLPRLSRCPRGLLCNPLACRVCSMFFCGCGCGCGLRPRRSTALSRFCTSGRRIRRGGSVNSRHQRLRRRTGSDTKRATKSDRIHALKCSRLPLRRNSAGDSFDIDPSFRPIRKITMFGV